MNLTVANKIIGGFLVIIVFLAISSAMSLLGLNDIDKATKEVTQLAIPTLKGSNELDQNVASMGAIILKAYYQTSIPDLEKLHTNFQEINQNFESTRKKLASVVNDEPKIAANLRNVSQTYDSFLTHVDDLFSNRKASINLLSSLHNIVSKLEDTADETATTLLDLADHDLADTKLKNTVAEGERLETLLNNLVSSALEFRDTKDAQGVKLVEMEITNTFNEIKTKMQTVVSELKKANVTDIASDLMAKNELIDSLIQGNNGIINTKHQQLTAIDNATKSLAQTEADIKETKALLAKQVAMAEETTANGNKMLTKSVASGTTQTTVILIISILIAIAIAYVTVMSITKPLDRINDILKVVASGDLSRKLDETGKDEFAELAKNCNAVIESLRTLIQGIINRSTQLAAAAEQTSAVTAQSTAAIEEQRNQVEQAATATTEMSSTAQSMLMSVSDALNEIKQADQEAEHVKQISIQNKLTIERLAKEVDAAAQVINKLEQDSASIGRILDVIRGIAEQTNLLALNAAIEAARAGEQGRGFAVVADEVRTLASRTQESTQEIQNMIEVLQNGAKKAVTVMDNGKNQATECVNQADTAAQALEVITEAVHQAYDRSTQVASAAEEQSSVAHEISANLESIVAIAEQTTAGAQQTAASSSEVAKLAEELQQSVKEFKV
jgi:methyl-accepting chemotaxis protein